jgi:hypothetical protein
MTTKLFSGCLITGFLIASQAQSATSAYVPTLDALKEETTEFLKNLQKTYTLTSKDNPTSDDIAVKINGTFYYLSDSNSKLDSDEQASLKTLIQTGFPALQEITDENNSSLVSVFSLGDAVYGYDPNAIPSSGYSLTKLDEYQTGAVTLYQQDENGQLIPEYYKIELNGSENSYEETSYIIGDFIGNDIEQSWAGVIEVNSRQTKSITGDFIKNSLLRGGVLEVQ